MLKDARSCGECADTADKLPMRDPEAQDAEQLEVKKIFSGVCESSETSAECVLV
jgi:hypothetical protein